MRKEELIDAILDESRIKAFKSIFFYYNLFKISNMKTVEEFVKSLVKVDFIENSDCYGHYPFQLLSTDKEGKTSMCALALGGDVQACYERTKELLKPDSVTFLSLDFPAVFDAKHDFIAVYEIRNKDVKMFAIPYDEETGEVFEKEIQGNYIDALRKEFIKNVGL